MKLKHSIFILLASLAAVSCGKKEPHKTLTLVTYNVGAFVKSSTLTIDTVASMMKELAPDAIGLNELDSCTTRPFTEGLYELGEFAAKMGDWNCTFAPAINYRGGKYGIGIVSRPERKVLNSYTIQLSRGEGKEVRALAVQEFEDFVFASTHLDYFSEPVQLQQVKEINAFIFSKFGLSGKPIFLCGDTNATPDSGTIAALKKDWTMLSTEDFSFPAKEPVKCIDYFFVLNNGAKVKLLDAKVCSSFKSGDARSASDHLPVMIKVKI